MSFQGRHGHGHVNCHVIFAERRHVTKCLGNSERTGYKCARSRNPVLMFQLSFAIFSLVEENFFLWIFYESVSWDQRFSQPLMNAVPLLINLCISPQGRLVIMLVYYQMEKFSSLQNWKVRILDNIGICFEKTPVKACVKRLTSVDVIWGTTRF